jgi:hypothetical protein
MEGMLELGSHTFSFFALTRLAIIIVLDLSAETK